MEPTDLYNDIVNAVFHCVLNDDFDIFKVLCETSQHDIDWAAVDSEGRTILSRIIDVDDGYGFKNDVILNYLVKHIGKARFKTIAEIPDHHGKETKQTGWSKIRSVHSYFTIVVSFYYYYYY